MPEIGKNHYFNGADTLIKDNYCRELIPMTFRGASPRLTKYEEVISIAEQITVTRNTAGYDNLAPFMNGIAPNPSYKAKTEVKVTIKGKTGDLNSIRYGITKQVFEEQTEVPFNQRLYYLFNNSIDLTMRNFLNENNCSDSQKKKYFDWEPKWFKHMEDLCTVLGLTPYKTSFDQSEITFFDERYLES